MRNECINRTLDGGCRKLYVACPEFILDVTELGCGGVCCEFEIEDKYLEITHNDIYSMVFTKDIKENKTKVVLKENK